MATINTITITIRVTDENIEGMEEEMVLEQIELLLDSNHCDYDWTDSE